MENGLAELDEQKRINLETEPELKEASGIVSYGKRM
jgi:hypothetical protein